MKKLNFWLPILFVFVGMFGVSLGIIQLPIIFGNFCSSNPPLIVSILLIIVGGYLAYFLVRLLEKELEEK